jgi:hypothetical protein
VSSEQEPAYHGFSRGGANRAGLFAAAVPLRSRAGAFGLRPLRYPGGGGKVPGGYLGWLVAALVMVVVVYFIVRVLF